MALFKLLKISVMLIRNSWVLKQRQNVKSIHILIKMVVIEKKRVQKVSCRNTIKVYSDNMARSKILVYRFHRNSWNFVYITISI